jgi:hypothetical protein
VYYPAPAVPDPCDGNPAPGTVCNGGALFAGVIQNAKYMVTPSGCTNPPTAPGCTGADSLSLQWKASGSGANISGLTDGADNTSQLDLGFSDTDAAKYCAALTFGGYTDWFLPAKNELLAIYTNRTALNFLPSGYWTSTSQGGGNAMSVSFTGGAVNNLAKNSPQYVRCARRF